MSTCAKCGAVTIQGVLCASCWASAEKVAQLEKERDALRADLARARAVLDTAEQIPMEFLIPEPGLVAVTMDAEAWQAWREGQK